ncbi:amidohydrolase family protein [Peristeroidobacter soli]|jgi:Tol biopolymer transport system component|uniref:amidohydrolase family protein n=1 Tax=Peristeroidobacter soli TaxID=2497877 RepID=UPI00101DF112|nr:amidohydrolase family protein [Peristeroidobacter soli]
MTEKRRLERLWLAVGFALLSTAALAGEQTWNVNDTGQPYVDAEFTVNEGTWMSVDVSPDGATLAFDLLGDIYVLPVKGGDARLVHGGPAMQIFPSFSADGSKLLYQSDESGYDNAWISNVDGSNARQITHDAVNMLGAPTWGPNDESVAVVQAYSTFQLMKASEIRLFDMRGGKGAVLVEMPGNRRDVQEPSFTPDGKFVYYTQRIIEPNIYVNAMNPNYVIKRRELESGATEELMGGWGSATTPEVSHDGKKVAFIRRVKEKTVLFIYDVATRTQTPVFDDLDRDLHADFVQQNAYYPRFDWFPDNRHIAIWGKGKLYNVDTQTSTASEIPFRVHARHRIVQAPHFEQNPAPDSVSVRSLRQLAPSNDGTRLVFTALDRLWTQSESAAPARLTKSTGFEFDPAFSRDGRSFAYVEWDDERGSTLKVANSAGRNGRAIATSRGVIRNPSFSPDGKRVVYRIDEADKNMGGYGTHPGIYIVPAAGGESRFVVEGDDLPMFSPDGQRIYYIEASKVKGELLHSLVSVTADGTDKREHAHTLNADTLDLHVSPDLRWIAFRETQQFYVMPFQEIGAPLTVSARNGEVPVRTLTDLGGHSLTWSSDSSTLYWTLGASLYRARVGDASSTALPQPYAKVDLKVPADVPTGKLAFTNARIITMKGDEVIEQGTVVVDGNRIVALGASGSVTVPSDAKVVDAAGKTIMPGLVDMHGHIDCCYRTGVMPQKQAARYAAMSFGVTTNFDPYSSELPNYETRETDLAGITVGPRWIGSGSPIYGRAKKTDFNYVPLRKYDDAHKALLRKQALGDMFIKSYKQPGRQQRQMLVKAGRETGIMVDVEGEGHFYNSLSMVLDGHSNVEHNMPVANYYDDVIQLMSHGTSSNTPTLIVAFGELYGENFLYARERAWEDPKVKAFAQEVTATYGALEVPSGAPAYARNMTSIHLADELWDIGFRSVSRSVKKLDDAGVRINVGSHGEIAGLAMHWEMQLLAQGGMSNHHILRAATLNGAKTLGFDKQLGSLEVGKLADLIVLDRNPLEDIRNSNSVRYTVLNGRLYDSATMNEIGNHPRVRTRFYWEMDDYKGIDWNSAWSGQ